MADQAPPAAPEAAPAARTEHVLSFVDASEDGDPAAAILDEVLTGADGAPAADAPTDAAAPAKPDAPAEPAKDAPPANDLEGARLRKGFAKLAEDRQKLIERENAARAQVQSAGQWREKAEKHDALLERLRSDPAGVIAELGDETVNKALQGFIDREKSPAERRVDELERQTKRDREANMQREAEQVAARWRADIAAKVQGDERFDLVNSLGLHGQVIDVITTYYEKHSERDDKGNITVPAILSWDMAAQAVEDERAGKLEASKRYGKRAPAADPKKDAPAAKPATAPAKRAPTSLSSVPVAETPHLEDDLPLDPEERQSRLLAELGL